MLEDEYQRKLNFLLSKLSCEVQLPEAWDDYFSRTGICLPSFEEQRRYQRRHCRLEAILEMDQTLPSIEREHSLFAIYTRDVSCGSISFLHTAQLYPCEECLLWLPARKRSITVTQCTRYNEKCYCIGAVLGSLEEYETQ